MPLELQAKLLRAIQERKIEPIGSEKSVSIDMRIISATHQDLQANCKSGKFRQDLYFRLEGASIKLPSLRERKMDIPLLARLFVEQAGAKISFSNEALTALERHPWPGNVRELQQVITRAALLSEHGEIRPDDLELGPAGSFESSEFLPEFLPEFLNDFTTLEAAQAVCTRELVQKILDSNKSNRAETARRLEVSERTLYRILAE